MLSLAWNQYLSAEVYFLRAKIVASPTHDIDLDEVENVTTSYDSDDGDHSELRKVLMKEWHFRKGTICGT